MSRTTTVRTYGVAAMAVLAFVAWMSFTKPLPTARPQAQQDLLLHVPTATVHPHAAPTATPAPYSHALAYLRIPRFGKDWMWAVSEGVSQAVLATGPGHYPSTPLPGESGNVAIAGHRAGHGDPFINFDQLRPGDEVLLSQNGATWTYRVTTYPQMVSPNAGWVLKPFAPGHWLTLTTCWPKYGDAKRLYVRAVEER